MITAMNPYFYLFYKLSCFLDKKGDNEHGTIFAISVLLGTNLGIIYISSFPVTPENYQSTYKYGVYIIALLIFILNYILFLNKKRVEAIMLRYKKESEINRKIGNILVVLYIALSLGSIVFI